MSKKNRGEKETAKLRREVEILKAQLAAVKPEWNRLEKTEGAQIVSGQPLTGREPISRNLRTTVVTDYSYLRGDLLKTAVLSASAFVSIFLVYFYQGKSDQILKLLSPILRR